MRSTLPSLCGCVCVCGRVGVGGEVAGAAARALLPALALPLPLAPTLLPCCATHVNLRSLMYMMGTPGILRSLRLRSLSHVATM